VISRAEQNDYLPGRSLAPGAERGKKRKKAVLTSGKVRNWQRAGVKEG